MLASAITEFSLPDTAPFWELIPFPIIFFLPWTHNSPCPCDYNSRKQLVTVSHPSPAVPNTDHSGLEKPNGQLENKLNNVDGHSENKHYFLYKKYQHVNITGLRVQSKNQSASF